MLPESSSGADRQLLIRGAILPTCCTDAWKKLRQQLKKTDPDIILLTGLAQKRERLSIERFALNIRDYRIEDNAGHMWVGQSVLRGGAEALKSALPLDKLQSRLLRKGFPCEISNNAGTFVCNEIYYRALTFQQEHPEKIVLFVHVPLPARFGKTAAAESHKPPGRIASERDVQMRFMLEGILETARFCQSLRHRS